MSESRRSTRHQVLLAATLEVDGQSHDEEIQNISLGGAYVTCSQRLAMGTQVRLSFRIPTLEQPIETGAQVRWTTDQGVGVQFDGLRAREVWSLNKYFEDLSGGS